MKGVFKRIGGSAVPAGKTAREALFAIPDGGKFVADVRAARNPDQHDLFWTICQLIADATDTTKEAVKRWLLIKTGYVDMLFMPDGTMRIDPKSIAFESMDQTEFNAFFQAAILVTSELLMSAPKEVIAAFNDLLDSDKRADLSRRLPMMRAPSIVPSPTSKRSKVDG